MMLSCCKIALSDSLESTIVLVYIEGIACLSPRHITYGSMCSAHVATSQPASHTVTSLPHRIPHVTRGFIPISIPFEVEKVADGKVVEYIIILYIQGGMDGWMDGCLMSTHGRPFSVDWLSR